MTDAAFKQEHLDEYKEHIKNSYRLPGNQFEVAINKPDHIFQTKDSTPIYTIVTCEDDVKDLVRKYDRHEAFIQTGLIEYTSELHQEDFPDFDSYQNAVEESEDDDLYQTDEPFRFVTVNFNPYFPCEERVEVVHYEDQIIERISKESFKVVGVEAYPSLIFIHLSSSWDRCGDVEIRNVMVFGLNITPNHLNLY